MMRITVGERERPTRRTASPAPVRSSTPIWGAIILVVAATPLLLMGCCGVMGLLDADAPDGAFPTTEAEIGRLLSQVGLVLGLVGVACLGGMVACVRAAVRQHRASRG